MRGGSFSFERADFLFYSWVCFFMEKKRLGFLVCGRDGLPSPPFSFDISSLSFSGPPWVL